MATLIYHDTREIEGLYFPEIEGGGGYYKIGSNGITKIEAYQEMGQCGYVAWFNVWKEDKLYLRINGMHVEHVEYK